ncbi:MAG: M48 family metalloprotease [Bacteroidetes bacterium]|nr:M48 family metalloprotease [Bacteroidota bacterium]
MMDGANSEAFIASVLTHELAHYSRRHSVQWFMEKLKGTYGGNVLPKQMQKAITAFRTNLRPTRFQ